jgi:MFS family permease
MDGDKVAGYIGSQAVMDEADVMNIAIDPAYRRRGIAERLVSLLATKLIGKGVKSLTLEVRASNMPAIALYFESSMHEVGMSTSDITKALFMVPVVYATITFLSGFIADKLGRKVTVAGFSTTCIVGYALFVAGILLGWNPYLIGAFAGLYQGSYWIGRDYMNVMMTEKVPTDIRASVVGAEGLLVIIGLVVGYGAAVLGMLRFPIWWVCLAISVVAVGIAAIMFATKVKETKGVNLNTIEH